MKKALSLYLFILFATITNAQNMQWVKGFEGDNAQIYSMVIDDSGNVYSVGAFNGIVDFDPGENSFLLNTVSTSLGFISKLDKNGNFVWAKKVGVVGSNTSSKAVSIAIDTVGHLVIAGEFIGNIDFNPSGGSNVLSTKTNSRELFVLKINQNGGFIWVKKTNAIENNSTILWPLLKIDKHSNIYISGWFKRSIDFNPDTLIEFRLTSAGSNNDIFILKLNSEGEFKWAKKYGGTGDEWSSSLSIDSFDNVIISGHFRGIVDFEGEILTSSPINNSNQFILKLDIWGDFKWVKQITNSNSNPFIISGTNNSGEVIAWGRFTGTINLDTGISNYRLTSNKPNAFDLFLAKYDSNGQLNWVKHFASESNLMFATLSSLTIDNQNNILLVGYFSNTVDFDPNSNNYFLTSNGATDIFVAQYDSLGEFVWAKSMGGKMNDRGNAVYKGSYGALYVAGVFADTVEFDPGDSSKTLIAKGYQNGFICKFANCTDTFVSNDTLIICSGSSFWVGNKEHSVSGDFLDTFTSYQGCDSIVYTHLIVLPPPDTLIDVTICAGQSYSIANNEYWESGTYVDTIKTTEGCDSIVTTNITVTPAPEFILPVFLCEGETYNFNGRILNSEGRYTDTLSTTEGCDSLSTVEISFYPPIVARIEERLPILRALPSGANYQWYDCNNNFTTVEGADSQDFHPPYNGLFAVRVTRGECEEISECMPYFKQYGIYMPNSFSPNGDGKNDTYRPVAEGWIVSRMTVYNRWGELLFDSQDPQAAWDGSYKGQQVQSGVYIVRVTFNSIETGAAPFRSVTENISVHLMR